MNRVGVVVPTCRRPALLARCLEALAAQQDVAPPLEVVVADDRPAAATEQVVRQWEGSREILPRYVPVTGAHGPAAARNLGWQTCQAPWIGFTDDDCVPNRRWVSEGMRALAGGADAVWGRVIVPLPPRPTDFQRDAARLQEAGFVTANCFCRRGVLRAVGGFDERFTTAWREDSDLYFSLLERGYRVMHAPRAVVQHPVRPAPWGVSLRQQRKAMFNALLFKKHPRLYRRHLRRTPWHYYAHAGGLALAGLAGVSGSAGLLAAGLSLWAATTAGFCAQRLRGASRSPRHLAEMAITSALVPTLSVYWNLRGAVRWRVFFM